MGNALVAANMAAAPVNDHYRVRTRRHPVAPMPRCDVCHGQGLLELAPVKGGRWACVVCRHDLEYREKESKK